MKTVFHSFVTLSGGVPALSVTISVTDTETLVVKLARADLVDVSVGNVIEMSVIEELMDRSVFIGSDTVRIIVESDEEVKIPEE
ncbi:MAG: hypothetical protein ACT6FF_03705 [Methanosarcinaceae archaeon]